MVWRFDGTTWSEAVLPAGAPSQMFKVHGRAADDVWIAGGGGGTLHWNGRALEHVQTGVTSPLFSVVTTPEVAIAVGGVGGQGHLLEHDGTGWSTLAAPQIPVAWRGAAAFGDTVYAVGENGVIGKRGDTGWTLEKQTLIQLNFHSAWVDPDGGLWGVGGKFDRSPLTTDGFLLYFGTQHISEVAP